WIILGIKSGIWSAAFLSSIFTTIFLFSVMLTVVVLIGVTLESTALAVMIPTGLMIISPLLAQHEKVVKLLSSETSRTIWIALYNVLPKVYDVGKMTVDFIFNQEVQSFAPVWSSAAFGVAVMAVAIYLFQRRDF